MKSQFRDSWEGHLAETVGSGWFEVPDEGRGELGEAVLREVAVVGTWDRGNRGGKKWSVSKEALLFCF